MNTDLYYIWEGGISDTRLDVLKTCMYSAKKYNPERKVILFSNSIEQDKFDDRVEVRKYDYSIFDDIPLNKDIIENFYATKRDGKIQLKCHPREFSDLFRLILLYKLGGSYIDTDDLCIKEITDKENVVCRSYDPHTHHYSKVSEDRLLEGKYREIRGYDDIKLYPRNDCWLNWKPKSEFLYDMLSDERLNTTNKAVYIGDDMSFQSLTLDVCNKHIEKIGETWNLYLTLAYLYEGHVSVASFWDRGDNGGEMHDIYRLLPNRSRYRWGFYKCNRQVAKEYLNKLRTIYPACSFVWLHDKDMIKEYFDEPQDIMLMSSQIYHDIKEQL